MVSLSCSESQFGFQGSSEGEITTVLHSNTLANNQVPSSTFPRLFIFSTLSLRDNKSSYSAISPETKA